MAAAATVSLVPVVQHDGEAVPQHVIQLATALASVMGPALDQHAKVVNEGISKFCADFTKSLPGMIQVQNPGAGNGNQKQPCECDECSAGGSCAIGCGDPFTPIMNQGMCTSIQSMLQKCRFCRKIDPCVAWMYLKDAEDLDAAAWEALLQKEGQLVHIDKFVGAAPYVDFPLAANKKGIFTQNDQQQLSYWPEILKLSPDWTGTPMPSKVVLRWFTGPKGLTGLTGTSALIQIGEDQTLADYACGDSCYVIPFPKVRLCPMGHIPMQRAVYLEVETKAIGAAEVAGINATIIKRGTEMWERWWPVCKLGPNHCKK